MSWKVGKKIELNNSSQIAAYRQLVNQEKVKQRSSTQLKIQELEKQLNLKNTYMHIFKGDHLIIKEKEQESTKIFVYD